MTDQRCHVYGNTHTKDPTVSFHCIPKATRRAKLLEVLGLCEDDIKQSTGICSHHFPNKDSKNNTIAEFRLACVIKISIDYTAAGFALYCINDVATYMSCGP